MKVISPVDGNDSMFPALSVAMVQSSYSPPSFLPMVKMLSFLAASFFPFSYTIPSDHG